MLLDRQRLSELRTRLARPRLPAALGDGEDQGVPRTWLGELLADWRAFDTDVLQDRLDAMTHLQARVGRHRVHAVHVRGQGPDPVPLLAVHGWPGSFLEHLPLLPLLGDPATGTPSTVLPSLPGFGFSGPPGPHGLTGRAVAGLLHRLMVEGLGHPRYVAHGSDLGAGVAGWLARDNPEQVAGIHLATPGLAAAADPRTRAEERYAAASAAWSVQEGAYAHLHATKPRTLGAALEDSPVGLAAWIGEKVRSWSSVRVDGEPAFDRDLLLSTLTLYWVTGTVTTSLLPYQAAQRQPAGRLPVDDPSTVPTAVSVFGGERVPFPKPPRELAARYYRLVAWQEHPVGGHFPAVAEPELLAHTLRSTLLPLWRGPSPASPAEPVPGTLPPP
nr:epoxide hydrolase family protein [Auraticoccus monumenti]